MFTTIIRVINNISFQIEKDMGLIPFNYIEGPTKTNVRSLAYRLRDHIYNDKRLNLIQFGFFPKSKGTLLYPTLKVEESKVLETIRLGYGHHLFIQGDQLVSS